MDPVMSANNTVTCLRSPSRGALKVRRRSILPVEVESRRVPTRVLTPAPILLGVHPLSSTSPPEDGRGTQGCAWIGLDGLATPSLTMKMAGEGVCVFNPLSTAHSAPRPSRSLSIRGGVEEALK